MNTIKVVVVTDADSRAEVREIPDTLEALQEIVGGYIEHVRVTQDAHAYVNEDGRSLELQPTMTIGGVDLVGPVVFSSSDEDGAEVGLEDAEGFARDVDRMRGL